MVAEIGGYAEGTFLDSTVTAGVNLQVMNNFKGSYYFDGSFKPFDVKVGIYYQYYFPSDLTKCGADKIPPAELIEDVKKSVSSTIGNFVSNIFSKASSAVDCIKAFKIVPVRKDLFDPFSMKGEIYSKRLAEGEF